MFNRNMSIKDSHNDGHLALNLMKQIHHTWQEFVSQDCKRGMMLIEPYEKYIKQQRKLPLMNKDGKHYKFSVWFLSF